MITALTPAGTNVILIIIEKRSLIFKIYLISTYSGYCTISVFRSRYSSFRAYFVIRPNNASSQTDSNFSWITGLWISVKKPLNVWGERDIYTNVPKVCHPTPLTCIFHCNQDFILKGFLMLFLSYFEEIFID